MPRPLSQLIYTPIQPGSGGAPIITLHDHNQFGPSLAELGVAASPNGKVTTLESYKGVFVGKDIEGYTWFLGPMTLPSPVFFGDSLAEIERFLWDEIDRSGEESPELPYLLGVGQGGMMAIATALAVPDLISGVIAIDCFLPVVPGWDPPLAPLQQLPIVLVNPRESSEPRVLAGDALENQLREWDAAVSTIRNPDLSPTTLPLDQWVSHHTVRRHGDHQVDI